MVRLNQNCHIDERSRTLAWFVKYSTMNIVIVIPPNHLWAEERKNSKISKQLHKGWLWKIRRHTTESRENHVAKSTLIISSKSSVLKYLKISSTFSRYIYFTQQRQLLSQWRNDAIINHTFDPNRFCCLSNFFKWYGV